jgi:hypothetical protein
MMRRLAALALLPLAACGGGPPAADPSIPEIDVRVVTEADSRRLPEIPLRLVLKAGALADADGRPAQGDPLIRSLELVKGDPVLVVLHVAEGSTAVDVVGDAVGRIVAAFRARSLPGAPRLRIYIVSDGFEKPLRR